MAELDIYPYTDENGKKQSGKASYLENTSMGNYIVSAHYADAALGEFIQLLKDNDLIAKRIKNLINNFASAGLSTRQVTNDDLRIILDNFLNGGQTTTFGTVVS